MMPERNVYGIGETVLDIIFKSEEPQAAKAGGSSLNAMISLGRLGAVVKFISEMGSDRVGDMIQSFLQKNGVDTSYIHRFQTGKSAISMAFLDEQNDASYEFFKDYPNQRLQARIPHFTANDILLFGSYYAINASLRPEMKRLLDEASQAESCIVYDPNFRISHAHEVERVRNVLWENFDRASIVRGSNEDFLHILGTDDPQAIYQQLRHVAPVLLITSNSNKVFLFTPAFQKNYPVQELNPVCTIGAGDNFNAGLVYGLLKLGIYEKDIVSLSTDTWDEIITHCIAFSSDVCMHLDNYISHETAKKFAL